MRRNMVFSLVAVIYFSGLASSCAPSEAGIATAIAQTQAANHTRIPTSTVSSTSAVMFYRKDGKPIGKLKSETKPYNQF